MGNLWGLFERGGGGGLIYFLRKLHDNFSPAQRNVCKTAMNSNNFNTTLNYIFFNYSTIYIYICFKMFMTCMMHYVILAKIKAN